MSADCFLRPAPQRDDLGIVLEEVEKLLCGLALVVLRQDLPAGMLLAGNEGKQPSLQKEFVDLAVRELVLRGLSGKPLQFVAVPLDILPKIQPCRIVFAFADKYFLFLYKYNPAIKSDLVFLIAKTR